MFKKNKDKYTIKIAIMFVDKDGNKVIRYEPVDRHELPKNDGYTINKHRNIQEETDDNFKDIIENIGNFKDMFWEE